MAAVVNLARTVGAEGPARTILGRVEQVLIKAERRLQRASLHVHAWRISLDPDLPDWIERASKEVANDPSAGLSGDDLSRIIEDQRRSMERT